MEQKPKDIQAALSALFFAAALSAAPRAAAQTMSVPVLRDASAPSAESPDPSAPASPRELEPAPAEETFEPAPPAAEQTRDELEEIRELERAKKKAQKKAAQLNRLNPLVPRFDAGAAPAILPPALSAPTVPTALAGPQIAPVGIAAQNIVDKLSLKERVLKLAQVVRGEDFARASKSVVNSPNLRWFYAAVLVLFFAFLWLRRRVLAATDCFLLKILLKGGIAVLFFVALMALSSGFFGRAAMDIVTLLSSAL